MEKVLYKQKLRTVISKKYKFNIHVIKQFLFSPLNKGQGNTLSNEICFQIVCQLTDCSWFKKQFSSLKYFSFTPIVELGYKRLALKTSS